MPVDSATGFDAVKLIALVRLERRPARLDPAAYPHLPRPAARTTSSADYAIREPRRTGLHTAVADRCRAAVRGVLTALRAWLDHRDREPAVRGLDPSAGFGAGHWGAAGSADTSRQDPDHERRQLRLRQASSRHPAHSAGTKQSQANQKNIGPETDEITTDWSGTPPPIYKGLRPGPFENRRTTTALACFYSAPTAWNSTANDSNATSDASIEVERCEFTFGVNLRAPHTMHCLVLGLTEICDRPQAEI